LTGTTPQSGPLKDPVARFGYRTDGALLERLADQVARGGQFTDLAFDVPTPEPVQAPVSKCGHVPLDGGPSDTGDFRGFLARDSTVQHPKDQHFFPNPRMRMRRPLLIDNGLPLLVQLHAKPSHGVSLWVVTRAKSTSLSPGPHGHHNRLNRKCLARFRAEYNNPVRRGLAGKGSDWRWSSAGWFDGLEGGCGLIPDRIPPEWIPNG
jgi:hypothetical protein